MAQGDEVMGEDEEEDMEVEEEDEETVSVPDPQGDTGGDTEEVGP